MNPKISIILPVHNRFKTTENFIRHLLKQDYDNYHLILIDDGSTDGTSEMVLSLMPAAKIIKGDGSLWWGGALQEGYIAARPQLPRATSQSFSSLPACQPSYSRKTLRASQNMRAGQGTAPE